MFAICIESSHKRGMGHFYRALNILEYLNRVKEKALILVNNDKASTHILDEKGISYEEVDYSDITGNWERRIIHKYKIDVWLLDKYETSLELAQHVKQEGTLLVAIDDCGRGAALVDLHFYGMLFRNHQGKRIYVGKDYLILNQEIAKYRRLRTEKKRILVTLGGSDTYGVTVKVIRLLKKRGYHADIVIGPNFRHMDLLEQEITEQFNVYRNVPSLIAKFYEYDLAITGGGVTCYEAYASGLPCIIIANEPHEIETGRYLAGFHGAKFAGYHEEITEEDLDLENLDIKGMSSAALQAAPLNGMENIYKIICSYREGKGCRTKL